MTEPRKQKPRGVRTRAQIGFFPWLRDRLYDVVYSEGDFALQFIADFFRGCEPIREAKHIKRQMKFQAGKNVATGQGKPLSKSQQKVFADILKRQPSEGQIPYWKRKKAMLNNPHKQELVFQHIQLQKVEIQKADTIQTDAGNFTVPIKQKRTTKRKRQRQ